MRAVLVERFTDVGSLRIVDVPAPAIAAREVLVQVRAAGLGFVDALKIGGLYQTKDPLPFVPGMEIAGVVCETSDASPFAVGDRVFGLVRRGALAENIAVPAEELRLVPDHVSFARAAAVPVNYLTALYGLRDRANLATGETLLVLGAAGGTGSAAIKVGRMLGATIVAAASTDEKRSFALAEGAHVALDYTRDTWRDDLASLTHGRPIDVIFDAVGGDLSPLAFRSLGWRGRHLVVGFAAGTIPALSFNIALLKGASLVGVDSAQIRKHEPEAFVALTSDVAALLASRALDVPPPQTFSFANFQAAFESIRSQRAIGKVVVEIV